jgi:tetratricopeptide (TPR) repeat protein
MRQPRVPVRPARSCTHFRAMTHLQGAMAALLGSLLAACSLAPAPIASALREDRDQSCIAAVAAFRANPDNVALALAASRSLFALADEAVQQALLDEARTLASPDGNALLAIDQVMPASIRDRILSLATTGAEAAQSAVTVLEDASKPAGLDSGASAATARVDAQVLLALHLSFVAWANGPVASLMSGNAKRITKAMDAAIALDPEFDHGAPLRLKGRFLARAPWPVGDRKAARTLLARAVQLAPMPIHHLFLGDLLFELGEPDAAVEQWQAVATATADQTTAAVAPLHREMARLRLQAVSR